MILLERLGSLIMKNSIEFWHDFAIVMSLLIRFQVIFTKKISMNGMIENKSKWKQTDIADLENVTWKENGIALKSVKIQHQFIDLVSKGIYEYYRGYMNLLSEKME
jgi:hypothetical protein